MLHEIRSYFCASLNLGFAFFTRRDKVNKVFLESQFFKEIDQHGRMIGLIVLPEIGEKRKRSFRI